MKFKILIWGFILIALLNLVVAQEAVNMTDYEKAVFVLNQSVIDIQSMLEEGFSVLRVNDTLMQIQQQFDAQYALEKRGGKSDYTLIINGAKEIADIKIQAFNAKDEITALGLRLEDSDNESKSYALYEEAKQEFVDERYEKVIEIVENVHVKIEEEKALQTRISSVYEASTKTIVGFFKKRWKGLGVGLTIFIILYFVLRKKVSIYLIDRKIKNLEFERNILQKMIKNSQEDYFRLLKIPEELYHVRIEKFGEMLRDIDRQIPILIEQREKIKGLEREGISRVAMAPKKNRILFWGIGFTLLIVLILSIIYFNFPLKIILGISPKWFIISILLGIFLLLLGVSINYLKEEKFPVQEKPKPRFIQFILNKIDAIKLSFSRRRQKVLQEKEYSRLLKQKRESEGEELQKAYLRKQKILSILKSPLSLFSMLGKIPQKIREKIIEFRRRREEKNILKKLEEKRRGFGI